MKSAQECVITHLPKLPTLKMDCVLRCTELRIRVKASTSSRQAIGVAISNDRQYLQAYRCGDLGGSSNALLKTFEEKGFLEPACVQG